MAQRILVVDDDREIVRLLRAYLEQAGYQALVAYDGETALHILRRECPDLVLLDLMLPDRDGWDMTRIVRGDPGLASTPIIMLTARVEDHDKILGLELGADDYVAKPFNPREVLARVRAVLRRAQGEPAPPSVIRTGGLLIDLFSGGPLAGTALALLAAALLAGQPLALGIGSRVARLLLLVFPSVVVYHLVLLIVLAWTGHTVDWGFAWLQVAGPSVLLNVALAPFVLQPLALLERATRQEGFAL